MLLLVTRAVARAAKAKCEDSTLFDASKRSWQSCQILLCRCRGHVVDIALDHLGFLALPKLGGELPELVLAGLCKGMHDNMDSIYFLISMIVGIYIWCM